MNYFNLETKPAGASELPIAQQQEWEKLKFGYKVNIPKDLLMKQQYKSVKKATELEFTITSPRSASSGKLTDDEDEGSEKNPISDVENQDKNNDKP